MPGKSLKRKIEHEARKQAAKLVKYKKSTNMYGDYDEKRMEIIAKKVMKKNQHEDWKKITGSKYQGDIDESGYMFLLTGPSQGNAVNERQGKSIEVGSLALRYALNINTASTTAYAHVRVILFQWKDCNGVLPTRDNLLQETSRQYLSPLSTFKGKEYKILHDEMIDLDYYNRAFSKKLWIGKKRLVNGGKIHYKGQAGTIADCKENNIFLFFITNSTQKIDIAYGYKISYQG